MPLQVALRLLGCHYSQAWERHLWVLAVFAARVIFPRGPLSAFGVRQTHRLSAG